MLFLKKLQNFLKFFPIKGTLIPRSGGDFAYISEVKKDEKKFNAFKKIEKNLFFIFFIKIQICNKNLLRFRRITSEHRSKNVLLIFWILKLKIINAF